MSEENHTNPKGAGGISDFVTNLKELPRLISASVFRGGSKESDRGRSQAIFANFFLHIHATKSHVSTLRLRTTFGLGVAAFSMFLILLGTGILLMVYYAPSTELAYQSIKDIHYVVPTGRLIRNIHRWGAHLMVGIVLLHMCRVFYASGYKAPREFNWVLGMALFVVTLALSFTGYLLPWDQLAYWAVTIGANIAASPRELTDVLGITAWFDPGGISKTLLLGANEVGQDALIRFYLLHVIVLPLVLVMLAGVHFWRIRKDGGLARPGVQTTAAGKGAPQAPTMTAPEAAPTKSYGLMCVVPDRTPATNADPENTISSWPSVMRAELLVFMVCMLACILLGMFFDAPLKEMANPAVPENPAKAPWYFLGLQEMVSYSAFMGGLIIPGVVVIGLTLIPYLDREPEDVGVYFSGPRGKVVAARTFVIGLIAAILSVAIPVRFGWLRTWYPDINQLWVIFVNPGSLLTAFYAAGSVLVLKRTGSTRMAAIALFTFFIAGFIVLTIVGVYFRGPNWDFYWSPSQWPKH
jgi:quinol-cytochrome oxidoreductase complex cytochrome b subunit